jgi:hypothetical protein
MQPSHPVPGGGPANTTTPGAGPIVAPPAHSGPQVPMSPDGSNDDDSGGKRQRGTDMKVAMIGAVATVIAAVIGGVFAVNAGVVEISVDNSALSKDDLQATVTSLQQENDRLHDDNDDLQAALDAATSTTTTTTTSLDDSPATTVSSGGGSAPTGGNTFLSDLDAVVDRGWDSTRDLDIDGTLYTQGIDSSYLGHCGTNGPGIERSVEYSIDRKYERFEAMAGLSEQSAPGLPVKLEIFGDGRSLWSENLVVGQPQPVDLDISGVLRLRLVATKQFENPGGCQYVYAALGDPSLQG